MKIFETSGYVFLSAPEKEAMHQLLSAVVNTARTSSEPNAMVECLQGGKMSLDAIGWAAVNSLILKIENNG
jgi:hypothetical protein